MNGDKWEWDNIESEEQVTSSSFKRSTSGLVLSPNRLFEKEIAGIRVQSASPSNSVARRVPLKKSPPSETKCNGRMETCVESNNNNVPVRKSRPEQDRGETLDADKVVEDPVEIKAERRLSSAIVPVSENNTGMSSVKQDDNMAGATQKSEGGNSKHRNRTSSESSKSSKSAKDDRKPDCGRDRKHEKGTSAEEHDRDRSHRGRSRHRSHHGEGEKSPLSSREASRDSHHSNRRDLFESSKRESSPQSKGIRTTHPRIVWRRPRPDHVKVGSGSQKHSTSRCDSSDRQSHTKSASPRSESSDHHRSKEDIKSTLSSSINSSQELLSDGGDNKLMAVSLQADIPKKMKNSPDVPHHKFISQNAVKSVVMSTPKMSPFAKISPDMYQEVAASSPSDDDNEDKMKEEEMSKFKSSLSSFCASQTDKSFNTGSTPHSNSKSFNVDCGPEHHSSPYIVSSGSFDWGTPSQSSLSESYNLHTSFSSPAMNANPSAQSSLVLNSPEFSTMFAQQETDKRFRRLQYLHKPPKPNFNGFQLIGDSMLLRFSQKLLGEPIINSDGLRFLGYCVSGQKVGELLQRLRSDFYHLGSKVILMIGTNDLLQGTRIEQMVLQLDRVVNMILKKAEEIIILTLPPVPRLEGQTYHWKRLTEYNRHIVQLGMTGSSIKAADICDIFVDKRLSKCKTDYFELFFDSRPRADNKSRKDLIHLNKKGLEVVKTMLNRHI